MRTYDMAALHRALRALPKEASAELRDASQEIAQDVATAAKSRAQGWRPYAKYVAPTIRATRDRYPVVKMGGNRKIRRSASRTQTVGNLIWGVEFGGQGRDTTLQFEPHLGTTGYALWPAFRALQPSSQDRYSEALNDALWSI